MAPAQKIYVPLLGDPVAFSAGQYRRQRSAAEYAKYLTMIFLDVFGVRGFSLFRCTYLFCHFFRIMPEDSFSSTPLGSSRSSNLRLSLEDFSSDPRLFCGDEDINDSQIDRVYFGQVGK